MFGSSLQAFELEEGTVMVLLEEMKKMIVQFVISAMKAT